MAGNIALYLALRFVRALLPVVPLGIAYKLAALAGTCAYFLFPIPRSGIITNLSTALDKSPDDPEVRKAARGAFANDAKNWIDTVRIMRLSDMDLQRFVSIEGWENLEAAHAQGKGVVIAVLHLGNFDLVGQIIASRGLRATIPVERLKPDQLFNLLQRERSSKGIDVVPLDEAPRAILGALRRGEVVGMAADRYVSGKSMRISFFGRDTSLPRAPVSVARHTGSPIVVGVGVRQPKGRFRGFFMPPIHALNTGNPEADDRATMAKIIQTFEPFVIRYPDQWLAFGPLWQRDSDENHAATIGHPDEAAV